MRSNPDQISQLLAACGHDDRTIYEFLRSVERYGSLRVMDLIHSIRNESNSLRTRRDSRSIVERSDDDSLVRSSISRRDLDYSLVDRIASLLQDEAHLPSMEAYELLRSSLLENGLSPHALTSYRPKEGLKVWLSRLLKEVPPSELLHHASKIRNSVMHRSPSDWPLKVRNK